MTQAGINWGEREEEKGDERLSTSGFLRALKGERATMTPNKCVRATKNKRENVKREAQR